MASRFIAYRLACKLYQHATSEKYPTRSVEYMLAWMLLVWSYSCALPGDILVGPVAVYISAMLAEVAWSMIGVVVGAGRIVALVLNGGYRPSPILRVIGAAGGLIWWLTLYVLYTQAVDAGAPDFPMRRVFLVFVFFEAYSCYRCGQDHTAMLNAKNPAPAAAAPASLAGHG